MQKNSEVVLHLACIKGVGPQSLFHLLSCCFGFDEEVVKSGALRDQGSFNLSTLYEYSVTDFVTKGLNRSLAIKLVEGLADRSDLDTQKKLLQRHQLIRWISWFDVEYPLQLLAIHAPPLGLFVQGGLLVTEYVRLAVVGSRIAGHYARQSIDAIVEPFAVNSGLIISGGARGIDGMAHKIAVTHTKPTWVVLGSGLLSLYPEEHIPLFKKVIDCGGSLISPFLLEAGPDRFNFPVRNRIIAGLSQAVLVVQAAAKSGALITAEYALQEGRTVLAIPGSIFDPLSAGTHRLLQQGAGLVTSYESLCTELGFEKSDISSDTFVQQEIPVKRDPFLHALQKPLHVEVLAQMFDQSCDEIESRLFDLQLEQKVTQRFDGSWIAS